MDQTVLVTGGTGFLARWCVAALLERGCTVRTTVRSPAREAAVRAAVGDRGQDRLSVHAADLTGDDGWAEAVGGCDYVLHVASPLGSDGLAADLAGPARDGTLRVLRAAADARVRRVVLTSSTAAATPAGVPAGTVADETTWTDPDQPGVNAYRRSKALAERAAWDFMAEYDGPMTLATVLPVAIFGPVLGADVPGSVEVIGGLLRGRPPGLPRLGFAIVDVRDVADLHLRAMTAPEAAGERFIGAGEFRWMPEIAAVLRERLGARAAKVPSRRLPSPALRALARVVPTLRPLTPLLDRDLTFSSAKARRLLGFTTRPVEDTIVDTAESILARS